MKWLETVKVSCERVYIPPPRLPIYGAKEVWAQKPVYDEEVLHAELVSCVSEEV